jgi:pentatricopeptide repeat protein
MIRVVSSRSHRVVRLWLQKSQASDFAPAPASPALTYRGLISVNPAIYPFHSNTGAAFSTNPRVSDAINRSLSLADETSALMKRQSFSDTSALAIVSKWNAVLKELQTLQKNSHVSEQEREELKKILYKCVKTIYSLLSHIRTSGTAGAQLQAVAFLSVLQALARVSDQDSDVALHAQELFDQFSFRYSPRLLEQRRMAYYALLTSWSNSTRPEAPDMVERALQDMDQEGRNGGYERSLIDVGAYNRAMGVYCMRGDVQGLSQLWENMIASGMQPNSHSYAAYIKAYKVSHEQTGNAQDARRAMELFLEQLTLYSRLQQPRYPSLQPHFSHLNMVLEMQIEDAAVCRHLLDEALQFETLCPECRGLLVNERVFKTLLVRSGESLGEARDLLQLMLASDHLQVETQHVGIVMNGYAARKTIEGVKEVESMLYSLEEQALADGPVSLKAREYLDTVKYHILMKAYLSANYPDAVDRIRKTIDRQSQAAKLLRDPKLRPDIFAYTTLQDALTKSGRPRFAQDVQRIFEMILASTRSRKNVDDAVYNVAMNAWANSNEEDADERAERIFDSMMRPTQISFNTLLNLYAKRGRSDKAVALVRRMRSRENGLEGGGASVATYYQVIEAIHGSGSKNRWSNAKSVFNEMIFEYERGDTSCFPNHAMVTIMFKILRQCDETKAKHREAQDVLEVLSALGLVVNRQNFTILTQACSAVEGNSEDKRKAFSLILDTFRMLKSQVDWKLFDSMLIACDKLLVDKNLKKESLANVFKLCANAGHTAFQILQTMQHISPPDLYEQLISQQADRRPDYDAIPFQWKRNCV